MMSNLQTLYHVQMYFNLNFPNREFNDIERILLLRLFNMLYDVCRQ